MGGGDEAEQQFAAGVVERGEANLIDDDQHVAARLLDDAGHGVVGDGTPEATMATCTSASAQERPTR